MKLFNWALGWSCIGLLLLLGSSFNDTLIFANDKKLQLAVNQGDAAAVYKVVRKGALVAISNNDNVPLIVVPIHRQQPNVLRALLSSKKTLPDTVAEQAQTAALQARSTDALSLLLTHNYKPGRQVFSDWVSREKPSPSHPHINVLQQQHKGFGQLVAGSLEGALDLRNFDLADELLAISPSALWELSNRPCCPNRRDGGVRIMSDGRSLPKTGPLQRAATMPGSQSTLKWLSPGRIAIDTPDSSGKTALMWAALYRRADNISALLRLGADPNAQDNEGRTALIYAQLPYDQYRLNPQQQGGRFRAVLGTAAQIRLIMAGADATLKDNYQLSALDYGNRMVELNETSAIAHAQAVSEPSRALIDLQRRVD